MANLDISPTRRREIAERANGCCEYCRNQQAFSTAPFSIEHIVPISKSGSNADENLAYACPACNAHKYTKTHGFDGATRKLAPLFNPRTQRWQEHFAWDDTLTQIIGLTPAGRATVQALKMNREESVNLRTALVAFEKHPPD